MEILPAIDVIGGKITRLCQGDYSQSKEYSLSPLEMAKKIETAGLKNLHLIDLDGAKQGRVVNWQVIEDIAKNTKLSMQVGGGARSMGDVKKLFDLGAQRVIIGSLIDDSPALFNDILMAFGQDKIIADLAVKDNEVFKNGWQEKVDRELNGFLRYLAGLGVRFILLTDIAKDGVLMGPNFGLYEKVIKDFPMLSVIASGGITAKQDLIKLSEIGVWGAVVGKALHEQKLSLADLQSLCAR